MTTSIGPPPEVTAALAAIPAKPRKILYQIRQLILQAAASNPKIGPLYETLKWGEPAFLTAKSKSGSTIRMAWKPANPDHVGLYFNCQTTLVETMRQIYPDTFSYQKNRAALLPIGAPLPNAPIAHICEMAMTYHLNGRTMDQPGLV